MKTKQLKNILKEPVVVYNDEAHTYIAPNGDLYTGCSTISEAWAKDFLGPWYAKEMFLEASARIGEIALALKDNPKPDEALKILEDCKGAARRKGNKAKEDGTQAHDWLEGALAVKINGKGKVPKKPESPEAKKSIQAFLD